MTKQGLLLNWQATKHLQVLKFIGILSKNASKKWPVLRHLSFKFGRQFSNLIFETNPNLTHACNFHFTYVLLSKTISYVALEMLP